MKTIKPAKIKKGDLIGVVAPSRHIYGFEKNINEGAETLKKMGFNIVFGKNYKKRFYDSAGKVSERAWDINAMFADKKIKAIICAIGGDSSNQILEYINYDLIKKNPKIIIGSSDITHLLLGIYSKTSMITFHGPNLKSIGDLTVDAKDFLLKLFSQAQKLPICFPEKMEILKQGKAKGRLIGGNLFVVNSLISSEFFPKLEMPILFWEDIDDGMSSIEFQLHQLKLSGLLDKISGIIIGNVICNAKKRNRPLKDIIFDVTKNLNIPIIKVDYFGHKVKNFYTFPIGAKASIDTYSKELMLEENVF